jgi:hypothetical protein
VNVSFSVSIVSLHLKLCKVCIEPERNARRSGEEFLCEKSLGSELSRSLRCKECMGNRSLHRQSSGGITLQKVLSRSRNPFPRRSEGRHLRGLRKSSKSEKLKAQEEERYRRWITWRINGHLIQASAQA